jgi:bacillithiol system protein YtxJ
MLRELKSIAEADALIDGPTPVWILKHSVSCSIAAYAMQEFMQYMNAHPDEPAAIVVVQRNRDVSDHLARRLRIRHESPQLLLVNAGQCLYHNSHADITVDSMEQARAGVL